MLRFIIMTILLANQNLTAETFHNQQFWQTDMPQNHWGPIALCGAGTAIAGDDDALVSSITEGALNASSSPVAPLSTTFHQSGCHGPTEVATPSRLMTFTEDNFTQLVTQIAVGQGEVLEALADLVGVQPTDRPKFYNLLRHNFTLLFPTNTPKIREVLHKIGYLSTHHDIPTRLAHRYTFSSIFSE